MAFSVNSSLLDFCVLAIVEQEDAYGYSITQKLQSQLDLSESTLYPVLRRLQKASYLETYDQEFQGRNRRYYKVTPEGQQLLSQYREDWEKHKHMIDKLVQSNDKGE